MKKLLVLLMLSFSLISYSQNAKVDKDGNYYRAYIKIESEEPKTK